MQIDLRYGRSGLTLTVADDVDVCVIRKPSMPTIHTPEAAVRLALDEPVCSAPLTELAQKARSACIAICDITRPVPNRLFLRPIIERLIQSGVSASEITILIATGLHRPNEGDELAELIGDPWVLDQVKVVNHFARSDQEHITLGRTSQRKTVVRLDRRFVEADIRIATGLVEPHFMAGYSGGRKVIAPGLAHAETITTFHNARFMADPAARNCNLAGNPLHDEQIEIVDMVGGALALNTVIDEDRNLSFVNFGDIVASHAAAVEFVRGYCEVPVERRFNTVVSCAAGYPLDKTYYQTIKGMVGALDILQPGGDLIIASECSEGLGSAEFVDAQRRLVQMGADQFLRSIMEKSQANIDEWQTQMQLKPMSVGDIYLCSPGLSAADRALTGVHVVDSIDEAVASSLRRQADRSVAIIPEGPYVVPFCPATQGV